MPGFALLDYNVAAAGINAVNTDLTAATDASFTPRNGHYLFTEQYNLGMAAAVGASVIRGRFQSPSWNGLGELTIFNANRSLQPPSNPQIDDYRSAPLPVPMYEEVQVQLSNNLAAATEIENCVLWLLTPDWSPQLPGSGITFICRASFTVTPTLNAWSGGQIITLAANLRNGVYAVVGGVLQGSNAVAFRVIFPNYAPQRGRLLRPGGLIQNAIGDAVSNNTPPWVMNLGEWGRFWSTELPQIEVFGTAAAATTYQGFLWLRYIGADPGLMSQGLGGGAKPYAPGAGLPLQMANL